MLLRAAQMSVKGGDGTPLHGACKMNADFSKIEFLSKEHPVAALAKDYCGRTPVSILWNNLPEINQAEFSNVIFSARGREDLVEDLQDWWRKTELLLRCSARLTLKRYDCK